MEELRYRPSNMKRKLRDTEAKLRDTEAKLACKKQAVSEDSESDAPPAKRFKHSQG